MGDKYRFYAIKQANEEIVKLESEVTRVESLVAERDATLTAAQSRITELESKVGTVSPDVSKLQNELAETKTLSSSQAAEILNLKSEVQATKASAEKLAASKALDIVASQGVPPVANTPTQTPGAPAKKGFEHLHGLERAIAAHRAEAAQQTK